MMRFALLAAAALACAAPAAAQGDLRPKLEALAAAGSGEAAYHLGIIHHLGLHGTAKDAKKAFELFKLAAERGDPLGAYKLGCYYDGQGGGVVEDDADVALRHKLIAADAGYALAQQEVGLRYLVRGDIDQGLRWLEAAARQGQVEALALLSGFFSGTMPNVPSRRDAVKGYAYMLLFVRSMPGGEKPTEEQMRPHFPGSLTDGEARAASDMASGWTFVPTPLTLKARDGQQAAQRIAAGG